MDTKLDQSEARATAAEVLLLQTKGQALEQYEALKKGLGDTLEEFESELAKVRETTNENIQEIHAEFEQLRVQLALGNAEARDSFEAQKKRIQHSINALEAIVDRELKATGWAINESLRKAANQFIMAAIKLETEMELLATQFRMRKDSSWDRFTHEKRALILKINHYKG
jgi:hypothetical protein